jgi:hypothetical protein
VEKRRKPVMEVQCSQSMAAEWSAAKRSELASNGGREKVRGTITFENLARFLDNAVAGWVNWVRALLA